MPSRPYPTPPCTFFWRPLYNCLLLLLHIRWQSRWDEASPASGRSGWASVRYCRYLVPPLPVLENADGRPQVALIDVSAHQPLTVTARARVPPADARRGSSRPPPTTSMQAAACVARHRPCDLLPAS